MEHEPDRLAAPEQVDHGFDEGTGRRPRPPEPRRIGRFSDGVETSPGRSRRRGRFSAGAEHHSEDPENTIERRFSEGIEGHR